MKAKYKQVKEEIQSWIREGKVKPHEKIQSENELVNIFGVSRHTIRQALGDLVHEGWLYREQGRGTFCASRNRTLPEENEKLIGIITTYISDYIFPSIIRGAEAYLSRRGYSILLASTNNDLAEEEKCLQKLLARNLDGLIVEPTKSAMHNPNLRYYLEMERKRIPYVMINAFYDELDPLSLTMDDERGALMAVEHVIERGHRKIAGLFKTDDRQGENRMKGFIKAHRKHQLTLMPELMVRYSTEEKETVPKEAVRTLLSKKEDRPTAIFCYNDEIALSVLDVIRDMELKVPQDISIVGFDNSHLAEASEVKLTSIDHPKRKMGEDAAQLLLQMIEQNDHSSLDSIVYQPELVVRNSTQSLSVDERRSSSG